MSAQKVFVGFARLPFDLEDADGNTIYAVMVELNGADRNTYLDFVDQCVKRDEKGKPVGMKTWKGSQTKLLSLCLHRAVLDETGRPLVDVDGNYTPAEKFTEKELVSWPDQALQFLTNQAVVLSRLNEKREETGND